MEGYDLNGVPLASSSNSNANDRMPLGTSYPQDGLPVQDQFASHGQGQAMGGQAMSAYDQVPMASSTSNANDLLPLSTPFPAQLELGQMDPFDHAFDYDEENMFGHNHNADDLSSNVPSFPFNPTFEGSDAFFEDPFSSNPFGSLIEQSSNNDNDNDNNSNSHLRPGGTLVQDNKLLCFSEPVIRVPVFNARGQTFPQMSAELYGMFFVAENVFVGAQSLAMPKLTCYRRNLFQLSGNIALSRNISHVLNQQGQQLNISELSVRLSARESLDQAVTGLLSVPWRAAPNTAEAPPDWPLNVSINPGSSPGAVSIPIAWKRLQFSKATANNGRRKGVQQHYTIHIHLVATLETGNMVDLAEIKSGPIIVRGRSPRNFDSSRNVPARAMSDTAQTTQTPQSNADPGAPNTSLKNYALNQLQQPLDLPGWSNSNAPVSSAESSQPSQRPARSSNSSARPPIPKWNSDTKGSDVKGSDTKGKKRKVPVAPLDLSLAVEDSRIDDKPRKKRSATTNSESPLENAEFLYEYFPLSVDDWMPPVDAIYRPHAVHHVHPPDMMAQQVKGKQKRYFSAEY